MEFTVPQFIEKEPKIVGPFTFKQFIYILIAGVICLVLYFTLVQTGKISLWVFLFIAIILLGFAFALAFLKIERTNLPIFIKNLIGFLFRQKVFLWQKKTAPMGMYQKREMSQEAPEEKEAPAIGGKSRLQQLSTRIGVRGK